jgi:malate dehydrogenase (oxaloacetate-decarboxylating)
MRDQRIAVVGAGGAGSGISLLLLQAMIAEGLSETEARSRFYLIDRDGLLVEGMKGLMPFQQPFVQPRSAINE